jgi:hypothetical protein
VRCLRVCIAYESQWGWDTAEEACRDALAHGILGERTAMFNFVFERGFFFWGPELVKGDTQTRVACVGFDDETAVELVLRWSDNDWFNLSDSDGYEIMISTRLGSET